MTGVKWMYAFFDCVHADPCNFTLCGSHALCSSGNSTEGPFDCACPPGFTGDPFSHCNGK